MEQSNLAELFSRYGRVNELELDEELQLHLLERGTYEKHQVLFSEIIEAHLGSPKYFNNRDGRRAPVIMLGATHDGRILCVPIEPTSRRGVWRPVTAFEANTHDAVKYRQE